MTSLNLDLPDTVLETVARLARDRNVPRQDIVVQAVGALDAMGPLAADLSRALEAGLLTGRRADALARQLGAARASAIRLARDLEEIRQARDLALTARRVADMATLRHRTEAARARETAAAARREADDARRRAEEAEARERVKVVAVMRDAEVAQLRRHTQDLIVRSQALEKDLEYARLDGAQRARKLASLERKLAAEARRARDLARRFRAVQKDAFTAERRVGDLMRDRAKLRAELQSLARLLKRGGKAP